MARLRAHAGRDLVIVGLAAISVAVSYGQTNLEATAQSAPAGPIAWHFQLGPQGELVLDGETLALSAVTNRMATATNLDAVALYLADTNLSDVQAREGLLERLTRTGVNVFLVAGEEPNTFMQKQNSSDRRAVILSTDQLRGLLGEPAPAEKSALPAVHMEWADDAEHDDVLLQRLRLGLPGRSVWLVHEDDGEEAMSGVQLNRDW